MKSQQQSKKPPTQQKVTPKKKQPAPSKARSATSPHVKGIAGALSSNSYAAALLNPDDSPNVGVPDMFNAPTHRFSTISNIDLPISTSGNFSLATAPSLSGHYYAAYQGGLMFADFVRLDADGYDMVATQPMTRQFCYRTNVQNNTLVDANYYTIWDGSIAAHKSVDALNERGFIIPSRFDNGIAGFKVASGFGGDTFRICVSGSDPDRQGYSVRFTTTTDGITFDSAAHADLHMDTPYAFTNGTAYSYLVKVEIASTTGVDTISLDHIELGVGVVCGNPASGGYGYAHLAYAVKDYDTYDQDMQAIRPVAHSALLTYRGPQLEGGSLAGRRMTGVESPSRLDSECLPYAELSALPHSFDSKVNTGCYSFWLPQSMSAFEFHPTDKPGDFKEGYILMAGQVTATAGSRLRLRVVTQWESITYSQKYGLTPSDVAPDKVWQALAVLSSLPCAMENETHWEKVKGWLKGKAKDLASVAWEHRRAIGAAALDFALA